MPSFIASFEGSVLRIVQSGDLTFARSLEGWSEALGIAPRGAPILVDVTKLTVVRSPQEIRLMVDVFRSAGIACPRLALVAADPVQWGLARVFAGYCDSATDISVFGGKGEALVWLREGLGEAQSA